RLSIKKAGQHGVSIDDTPKSRRREAQLSTIATTWPSSTASPSPTRSSTTLPEPVATTGISLFRSSTIRMGSSSCTCVPTGHSIFQTFPVTSDKTSIRAIFFSSSGLLPSGQMLSGDCSHAGFGVTRQDLRAQARMDMTASELVAVQYHTDEGDIVLDSFDLRGVQGIDQGVDGAGAVFGMDDDLGDHGSIERCHAAAFGISRFHANAATGREA